MRTRLLAGSAAAASLVLVAALPTAAGAQGPGHDLPSTPGLNVIAQAGPAAAFDLAFTGHTDRIGNPHGSIDYTNGGVVLTDLQLSKLAVMDEETATAGGCNHGAMIIARGKAVMAGVGTVRVWVDLQDRDEGDRVRVRTRAGTHDEGTDEGTEGGCGGGHDAGWLHNSGWQSVSDVKVLVKGYVRNG